MRRCREGRVGGGGYFSVDTVLIFAEAEMETETSGLWGGRLTAGCSTSHGPVSHLCCCTIGSLPCQSSCYICLPDVIEHTPEQKDDWVLCLNNQQLWTCSGDEQVEEGVKVL